jgi:hypothetical protein
MVVGICAAVALGGCEQTKSFFGLNKRVPDEFSVYSRAPLSLPPDFALRPPEPGSDRPQRIMPRDDALAALSRGQKTAGKAATAANSQDPGLQALLRQLQATNPDPDIRTEIDRETSILAAESTTFTDKLLFWRKQDPFGAEEVDPAKEAKRLQEAKALGKPLNEGSVPIISRKKKGAFEGLLPF